MGWAGALEGIFEMFAKDFKARGLNLYQNFRSLPRLRRMQNAMVKVMDPQAAVPDNELTGDEGVIEVLGFEDSQEEAEALADAILSWIDDEGVPMSEIAVLVSRQPELYAAQLMNELGDRGIPFRNEQELQDLSVEPASRMIVDFLTVVISEHAPDAFSRLMGNLLLTGLDEDATHELRARWYRFLDETRERVKSGTVETADVGELQNLANEFLELLGQSLIRGLAPEYEHGGRLDEVIGQTYQRISQLMQANNDVIEALSRFSEDRAVRIMTIHKSKGLEFDSVIVLGVEKQTFWGKAEEERSAFFVGISRAKQRLVLTVADRRERPEGYRRRWDENRTPHKEFVGYATEVL
jgi:superfamily I DNA/RNA helicase